MKTKSKHRWLALFMVVAMLIGTLPITVFAEDNTHTEDCYAKAGDLLFWRGHVGMYLGDGRYLHCTGHERVFGCRVNSLRRGDEDFREDLAEALKVVGSVFS